MSDSKTLSVTRLVRRMRNLLEIELGELWVEGEISNLRRQASGHVYFTLKDAGAQISCVLFKGNARYAKVQPDNGMQVKLFGEISVYEARGSVQLIVRNVESAGEGDAAVDAEKIRYYMGSSELLASAHAVKSTYTRGKVVEGTIGSGNFWNNEIDRMTWLHTNLGTSVEEMETSSAAMVSDAYGIPFLGVRVLSNNLTNNGKYDPSTAADCQKFVKEIVLHYISTL